MSQIHVINSDIFAQKQNWATGIDARIKMIFVMAALVVNLLSPTIYAPLAMAFVCLVTLVIIGVPPRLLAVRLVLPLIIALTASIVQMFFYGHTPLFVIPIGSFHITGYGEGLARGFLIMSRVIGGVALILLLSMSTPVNKLLGAAGWFRMSPTFIQLTLLVYRYVFVLFEEMETIRSAQRVRLGYRNWDRSMKSLSALGGSIILRAYDRSQRVFEAMLVRGYAGEDRPAGSQGLQRTDYIAIAVLVAVLGGFSVMGTILK